jgi:hypothetical protein
MGTKRRIIDRGKGGRLTPDIVDAWKRVDFERLHILLRLAPWEPSPLPREITILGCSQDDKLPGYLPDRKSLERSQALQRQLLAVAGWPDCRHDYEEQLREAEADLIRCRDRVENPPREQYCWIDKPEACRQALDDALDQVEYRKRLLAGLTRVQKRWARRVGKGRAGIEA